MAVITVYNTTEAVELSSTYRLFLKPKTKLTVTVILPEEIDACKPVPNWEILEQLKHLVDPDHFSSLKVLRSTKEFIRIEGEADTKVLALVFLEKLHGKCLEINSIKEPLSIVVTVPPLESPSDQELQVLMTKAGVESEDSENNTVPPAIHLEGLPCKWFSALDSTSEKPSEEVLKCAFEKFGKLPNLDIPMLDPYREVVSENFNQSSGGLQTFDAFLQYEDKSSTVNAVQSLKGMKLMFSAEDGKCLACDMKVTLDATKHFSEEAVNKRNDEKLKLQELEQQRKQEKEEEAERKRKAQERKSRARKRRAKLKRKIQKQKCEEKNLQEKDVCFDGVDGTEEWEERKLLLAQRRVESFNLLTILLDQVKVLFEANELNEEGMDCNFSEDSSDSTISTYSQMSESISMHGLKEEARSQYEAESEDDSVDMPQKYKAYFPFVRTPKARQRGERYMLAHRINFNIKSDPDTTQQVETGEPKSKQIKYFQHESLQRPKSHKNLKDSCCRKRKIYETDEFINYLLNYYDCPEYARSFLETEDKDSKTWCPRIVYSTGDTFQIKLKNMNGHFSEIKYVEEPSHKVTNDDLNLDIATDINTPESSTEVTSSKICFKEIENHLVNNELKIPLVRAEPHCVEYNEEICTKAWHSDVSTQSSDSNNELKDVLEKVSSTSEYFSEEHSELLAKNPVRKTSRKKRNISYMKKTKSCSFCDQNRICHQEDILGHLLHSCTVCQHLKTHAKYHLTPAYHKTNVHLHYNGETSESDTDEESHVVWNKKKVKKVPTSCMVLEKSHSKEKGFKSERGSALSNSHRNNNDHWEDGHNGMSKDIHDKTCCYGELHRKTKKISKPGKCYIPEYKTEIFNKDEEHLWDSDKTPSWSSSSSDNPSESTLQVDVCSKESFSDCIDWEQHFYCGEEFSNSTKYKS